MMFAPHERHLLFDELLRTVRAVVTEAQPRSASFGPPSPAPSCSPSSSSWPGAQVFVRR